MDLEDIMLSEISQSKKAKNHMISFIDRYKTGTHRQRLQYGGYQRDVGGGVVKGKGGQIYGGRDDLTLHGGLTMQYTCIVEMYI